MRCRVVFVCTGNRARSPLAEHLLRHRVDGALVDVASRGTRALGPVPALPEVVQVAESMGIDLTHHRAAPLRPMELRDADLVLGFEPQHVAAAVVDGGAPAGRVFTLPEFVVGGRKVDAPRDEPLHRRVARIADDLDARRRSGRGGRVATIPDPLGAPPATFARIVHLIDDLVAELADELLVGTRVVGLP